MTSQAVSTRLCQIAFGSAAASCFRLMRQRTLKHILTNWLRSVGLSSHILRALYNREEVIILRKHPPHWFVSNDCVWVHNIADKSTAARI